MSTTRSSPFPLNFRRQRQHQVIRDLFATVDLGPRNLIQPLFVYEELREPRPLASITGQTQHTLDSLLAGVERGLSKKISSFLLFIVPAQKKENGFSFEFDEKVIRSVKNHFGNNVVLFTDLCLCSNTLSGHCGLLNSSGDVDNQASVETLALKALHYARAGADVISPSDMMDDRIRAIRETLDHEGLHQTMIMSYSTKFSSQFYGPFRVAAQSKPGKGDRKGYQIDPRNLNDALRSSVRDAHQGADILMVKPAQLYLDVICRIKQHEETSHLPLCAYQVSGEYQSLWLMEREGLLNFKDAYYESLVAMKRAGSDLIITYGADTFSDLYL